MHRVSRTAVVKKPQGFSLHLPRNNLKDILRLLILTLVKMKREDRMPCLMWRVGESLQTKIRAEAGATLSRPVEFNTHCCVFREVVFLRSQKSTILPVIQLAKKIKMQY